jgi:hypothetical protein
MSHAIVGSWPPSTPKANPPFRYRESMMDAETRERLVAMAHEVEAGGTVNFAWVPAADREEIARLLRGGEPSSAEERQWNRDRPLAHEIDDAASLCFNAGMGRAAELLRGAHPSPPGGKIASEESNEVVGQTDAVRGGGASAEHVAWLFDGDTGLSSECIWRHMVGVPHPRGRRDYPHDAGDLGRCLRLLERVPEWRPRIGEMAVYGKAWAALAAAWDEIERLYFEDYPGHRFTHTPPYPRRCYDRMRAILDPVRDDPDQVTILV